MKLNMCDWLMVSQWWNACKLHLCNYKVDNWTSFSNCNFAVN